MYTYIYHELFVLVHFKIILKHTWLSLYKKLSFTAYPRIQPFSFPDKLTEGQKAKALCTLTEGVGPFKFLWYKNDQAITSSVYTNIENNKDYSLLFINSLTTDHAGNYTCVVTSSVGRDSYSSQLVVNGKSSKNKLLSDYF